MDPDAFTVLASVAGGFIVLWTGRSVIEMMLLPRSPGWVNPSTWVEAALVGVSLLVRRLLPEGVLRDRTLSWQGPVSIFLVLALWLALLTLGYGLLLWPWVGSLDAGIREAGSSMLTLGFADTAEAVPTAIDFLAAASGFGVITLHIGYLPTLYAAYSRREREVMLLASRAGKPAWGPRVLATSAAIEGLDVLPGLYQGWERWAADVAESHTSYRVLAAFRSPDPSRDWIRSLVAVLDAAGLDVALGLSDGAGSARMLRETGARAFRMVAGSAGLAPEDEADCRVDPPRLHEALTLLRAAGLAVDADAVELYERFRRWRAAYAPWANALARFVGSPPPPWCEEPGALGALEGLPAPSSS